MQVTRWVIVVFNDELAEEDFCNEVESRTGVRMLPGIRIQNEGLLPTDRVILNPRWEILYNFIPKDQLRCYKLYRWLCDLF